MKVLEMTKCNPESLEMKGPFFRSASLNFKGGQISSDGGILLLEKVQRSIKLFSRLAACFEDFRAPTRVEHPLRDLLAQRILAICLGYEDLNDHDFLSQDPLLAFAVGKRDVNGLSRRNPRDRGSPLASSHSLNRIELDRRKSDSRQRFCGFQANLEQLQNLLLELYFEYNELPPKQIILDIDHTDVQLHGNQEERFFHGHYDHHCYLPFFIFSGQHLLCAKLRPSSGNPLVGSTCELQRVICEIKQRWPNTKVIVRGDSGFCREELMTWLEEKECFYVFGLAKNNRLLKQVEEQLAGAEKEFETTGEKQRWFKSFPYRTEKTWTAERLVIGKSEVTEKGRNPRFVVTNLEIESCQKLYDDDYCARGEMENRFKETQLYLFGERLSGHEFYTNQLRLLFAAYGYVLISRIRIVGLEQTKCAGMRSDSIRKKLLKIGARIRITVRRIWIELSETYPYRALFVEVWKNLDNALEAT